MSKSSGVAKGGLITGIIGTSLAGLLAAGAGGDGDGGFLSGLFGGGNGAQKAYNASQMDRGHEAIAELNIVKNYVLPMQNQICCLGQQVAVNQANEEKNQLINALLFKSAQDNTDAKFKLAEATQIGRFDLLAAITDGKFKLAKAESDCCCATANLKSEARDAALNEKIDCLQNTSDLKVGATFELTKAQFDAKLCEAMKDVIKGTPYLRPSQMADPYQAACNQIATRQIQPVTIATTSCASPVPFSNERCGCGYSDWAW